MQSDILVFLPTYNEADNIKEVIKRIKKLKYSPDVLVVDDSSPDGTSDIVKKLMKKYKGIYLIERKENPGRGYAGRVGFLWALKKGYKILVEMDADLSHLPEEIPKLIKPILKGKADVVIGSRYIKGGLDEERGILRRIISKLAHIYIRSILRFKVRDCTSGFRAFSLKALSKLPIENFESTGPEIVSEILFWVYKSKLKIKEVPITFKDRYRGESKLNLQKLLKNLYFILKLKLNNLNNQLF